MLKKLFFILNIFFVLEAFGQIPELQPEFEASVVGGKEQLEQVLQTQLTLPKTLLTKDFEIQVVALFDVDSLGNPTKLSFKYSGNNRINNLLREELTRLLHFLKFKRTQHINQLAVPYHILFHLSTDKYNKYFKQKNKINLKKIPADSSYVIHNRADKSPQYYKNGEEGLGEFFLTEMEYPKVALEKSIEGTVIIEFVVETNGYITGIVVKQGVNGGCTEEAVRLLKQTKWQPAILEGKYVRYKTSYPITFSLRNVNKNVGYSSQAIGQ
jgi:TonB family protein